MDWTPYYEQFAWESNRSNLDWQYGHSYHIVSGKEGIQFACWDCGKDLEPADWDNHCWDCSAKFCDTCWDSGRYKHDQKHHSEETVAKREVKVQLLNSIGGGLPSRYKRQWAVDATPTTKNPIPKPYVVSEPRTGDMWECGCMNWIGTHPREDCKHIMRVKLAEAVPATVKIEPGMVAVQATGRMFR
jgi:hypothetical protein